MKAVINFLSKYICEWILIICLALSISFQSGDNNLKMIIRADGIGYYSYLPAMFIYSDYQFSFMHKMQAKYNEAQYDGGYLSPTPYGKVNKYYIGQSILWLPFFLIAHGISLLVGDPDGYSFFYQLIVMVASSFYLWLGCRYLRKLFMDYSTPPPTIALILLAIVFGTNLINYATVDVWATHVSSFGMISVFIYMCHSFFKEQTAKKLYIIAIVFALIALLRPTNAVVGLFFLYFATSFKALSEAIKRNKMAFLMAILLFLLVGSTQLFMNYAEVGHFFIWAYGEEQFVFSDPQIFNVLFSYRKGLFVYAPLILIAIAGVLKLFKENRFQASVAFLFLAISTYVISSWECWWYGGSLGQRSFVDYYGVFALLLLFFYNWISKKAILKYTFLITVPLLIVYSSVLSYQYGHYILHWDYMTKERFWYVFMKTDKQYTGVVWSQAFFDDKYPRNFIALQATSTGTYVGAKNNETDFLSAWSDKTWSWETFNAIDVGSNKVALYTFGGSFVKVSTDPQRLSFLKYEPSELKNAEGFSMIESDNKTVFLKAANNKYVRIKADSLLADAESINAAERFRLIKK